MKRNLEKLFETKIKIKYKHLETIIPYIKLLNILYLHGCKLNYDNTNIEGPEIDLDIDLEFL